MENKNNELKNTWVGCIFLVYKAIGVSLLVTVRGEVCRVDTPENILHLIVLFWEMWQKFSVVVWTKFYDL